jgi:hypothetical protein
VIEEPRNARRPSLAEVTPSLYPRLTPVERKFADRQFARLFDGEGRGLYGGPFDTARQVAQFAYTYGTGRTRLVIAPLIVGGIFMMFAGTAVLAVVGSVAFLVGLGLTVALMRHATQINAYFRQDSRSFASAPHRVAASSVLAAGRGRYARWIAWTSVST